MNLMDTQSKNQELLMNLPGEWVGCWKKDGGQKTMNSCQFSVKTLRKRKSLTVQDEFDKNVDIGKTELCFLSV